MFVSVLGWVLFGDVDDGKRIRLMDMQLDLRALDEIEDGDLDGLLLKGATTIEYLRHMYQTDTWYAREINVGIAAPDYVSRVCGCVMCA